MTSNEKCHFWLYYLNIPVEKKIVLSCFGILEVVKRTIIQDGAHEINIYISGTEDEIVKPRHCQGIDRNLSITVEIAFILSNSFQKMFRTNMAKLMPWCKEMKPLLNNM